MPSSDPSARGERTPSERREPAPNERRERGASASGERALAPVGVALLVALAVVLAGGVATATLGAPMEPPPSASLSLSAEDDRITLTHRAGDAVDVRDLSVRVTVDGEPLARQPPVPFFSAAGFVPGPTGPFNVAADPEWTAGESASVAVAGTNEPTVEPGSRVEVRLTVRGNAVATLATRVEEG